MIDWQAIVAEHGPQVWRTVYRLVSDREDALDCYQDTFLHAAQYAANRTVSNWPGLLIRMAAARALDCLRRRYRTDKMTAPLEAAANAAHSGPTPAAQAELHEDVDRLRRALATLPPRQSEVFCLREVELMSTAEVAQQLGVTPDDVATWLHRAKSNLRQIISDHDRQSKVRR